MPINALGQPIGPDVADWTGVRPPDAIAMEGRLCRVEPLDADRHAADLFASWQADADGRNWTYLGYGPFENSDACRAFLDAMAGRRDPLFHAIVDKASGKALGVASYLRIDTASGVVEVGHINYGPALQRSPVATEAMYLMMRRVLEELGYRRYEWKCDALNAGSRRAAERLGFTYEGLFRQATVYKGRNRDTAWFSVIDSEWPGLKAAFEAWLAPENFDEEGRQRRRLADLRTGG
ncbi:GNAT family N-acetyltransferase [Polymorphum gilvum]|uniref:Acetyltransferase, gnat family n=1 Tax=Polymorphum gilvum (strain LMG 25793 / CGMCC 1.9160 / SL003B-26A1) TaxID=991905 RepID=F2J0H1_POLGS|nr:GNAT family protein [Polymorphum gilvum]ADZ69639.1 Acetyltransferase, gnat family [Polymorphum gilvum SL003B-26A1]